MAEPLHFQIDEYYLDLQKQGQDMAILDQEQTHRNPFPGLRPFRTAEAHLFFGREGQAEELIARLMQTHFLGVLGNSGSGKSSLVRAGLIPALHAGKKQRRIADWKIVICRPGNSPVQNLAAALAGANKNTTEETVLVPEVQRLLPILQESSFGLLEAEAGPGEQVKTLLIVDQFEELFRFRRVIPPGEAAHFVDLLLTAVRQEGSHLYAVITMRSEFLGECVRYRGLPEIINEGQYLVPRLTGENVRRAVTGPLGVVGAPVDPTLVNRLVREVGDNMDQLPLLQHALMRTYHHWQQQGLPEKFISHEDYEAVGGIEKSLSRHANERFDALDEHGQRIAKMIFQRLTDLSTGDKGGRRPTLLEEIFGIAEALGATPEQTEAVIDHFRQTDTSFLMPPAGVPLQPKNMLDISHESLIRNWELLSGWAAEEVQNARLYQRLQQARLENDDDQHQGWIKGALLQRLEEWRQATPLNHFWAARYHENRPGAHEWAYDKEQFGQNMTFLDQCFEAERRREKEKEDAIVKEARQKQRTRYRNIISAISLVGTAMAGYLYWQAKIALEALTITRGDLTTIYLEQANAYIYQLKYDSAVAKAKQASWLHVRDKSAEVAALYFELAYFYYEAGETDTANVLLDSMIVCLSNESIKNLRNIFRENLRPLLAAVDSNHFTALEKRYYPTMINVRGGSFLMGSNSGKKDEQPVHKVSLSDYEIAETEITWWQYFLFTVSLRRKLTSPGWGFKGDNPAVYINWRDALDYVNWLCKQKGLARSWTIKSENGKNYNINLKSDGYRLPTEAEWEFAAFGGNADKDKNYSYAGLDNMALVGWFNKNSEGKTQSVSKKQANGLGLYDMSGNVWEWCWDRYDEDYYKNSPEKNPTGPDTGSYRVLRGGAWNNDADNCRVANRLKGYPDYRSIDVGFRPARTVTF